MTRIAIVSALHAELSAIVPLLEAAESLPRGGRIFHRGRLCGHEVAAILVTGDTAHDEIQRITASGLPVLFKPVQPRRLFEALRSTLS